MKSQFEISKEGGKCKMCKKFYKGKLSNLKDHLLRKHKEKADEIELVEATSATRNRNDDEIQLIKRIKLDVDVNQLIREMIRLMMNRNLSMVSADEIGQISLVKNALKEFKIVMNRHSMKRYIQHACENIFTLIREETENVLVSLMFDSASRYGRNVFGVSCRYIKDGQIADRTLGIITQEGRQFGEILAAQLENVIGKIGKCANDIYATCTDQGKNMMKASNILQNAQDQMKVILEIYGDEFIDFEDEDIDIGALENEEGNYSEAHTVCVEKSVGSFCSAMFCGARVCQLAAKDITSMFEDALNNIRKVAIESKKVAYIQTFKNFKKLRIDIEPRWDSAFFMIEDFHTNAEAY